jgi:trehalose synthase-fused probable maltokinase
VRRHDAEISPDTPSRALDAWKGAFLTDHTSFANTPRVYGSLEYTGRDGVARTVGVLSQFVRNDGDTWAHALKDVGAALEAARSSGASSASVDAAVSLYARAAANHGTRLGEFHRALSSGTGASEFRAVAPSANDVAAAAAGTDAAGAKLQSLLRDADPMVAKVLGVDVAARIRAARTSLDASAAQPARIHGHGDFHLGQMLKTGDDVQIIDLEGAPMLPLEQRWRRMNPLEDVARQRSSYEYAAEQGLRALVDKGVDAATIDSLRPVASRWAREAQAAFTQAWRDTTRGAPFHPSDEAFSATLRRAELDNALYETSYELASRPDWVHTPLQRLKQIIDEA